MHLIPTVIEKDKNHQYAYDIYSKLLEERIILLTGTIDDAMVNYWSITLFRSTR